MRLKSMHNAGGMLCVWPEPSLCTILKAASCCCQNECLDYRSTYALLPSAAVRIVISYSTDSLSPSSVSCFVSSWKIDTTSMSNCSFHILRACTSAPECRCAPDRQPISAPSTSPDHFQPLPSPQNMQAIPSSSSLPMSSSSSVSFRAASAQPSSAC